MSGRGRLRVDESLGEAAALRAEVGAWRSSWDAVDAMGTHLTHLDLLHAVLVGLVDEIARRIDVIDLAAGTGEVYEECRREDVRLLHTRRLWRWYADKLDQRAGPPDDLVVQTLRAADEVLWSCWKTAFTALGEAVPPAPIPYVAPQYSANATPRTDPPPELRPGTDDLLLKHIEQLPVAAVGLPPVCCRRPWWIILVAHEASHHVQFEAAQSCLEELTQERVVAAAYGTGHDVELAEAWRPWCRELFADACSVMLVGPAAVWAVAELEMRTSPGLRKSQSGSYPPPLVRLSVLRAVADAAGMSAKQPTAAEPTAPDDDEDDEDDRDNEDDDRIGRLLACVPDVAAALTALGPAPGRALGALGDMTARAYREGGSVAAWRSELLGSDEPVPQKTLEAARFCVAAGVDSWERFGGRVGLAERLASRLRTVLPLCAEPGTRGAGVARDADDLTRQLLAGLYQNEAGREVLDMRAVLELATRDGEQVVRGSVEPDGATWERAVRWAGTSLLVSRDEAISDEDATAVSSPIELGSATAQELARYGQLLFDAAFGEATWRELVERSADEPYLELAIRGNADGDQGAAYSMQALHWEGLHDHTAFVAARGTLTGSGKSLSVGIVRFVPPAVDGPEQVAFTPIQRIPRVLFAVGSRLTDPKVRPGAEFMGILRHLERDGGSIQPRVLESASLASLTRELVRFEPDVLHLIGHGRWFPGARCVKLQLRPETSATPGDDYVTARQVLDAFREAGPERVPRVVVLSACHTASARPGSGDQATVPADPVNALPFAAELVAGGVCVVVAMAGDIADTACRVFTRALTAAIQQGSPLVRAVILGRRAAFYERPDPDSIDWTMPTIFLAESIPSETCLVDTTATAAAKTRARLFDLAWEPVFCGRGEFIVAFDRMLDESDSLNVLVAHTANPKRSYGGMRLLRELGARAVRSGRIPVLLGPFDKDPPTDRARLAEEFDLRLREIRENLQLRHPVEPLRIVTKAADAKAKPQDLARAIRADLDELERDLADSDPVHTSPHPRVVLLCHRVDLWLDAFDDLLGMLRPQGLGPGEHPLPVVMTGACGDEQGSQLEEARLRHRGAGWIMFAPLGRFRCDDSDPEDILAYQWWLLNPPQSRREVYAPKRGSTLGWHALLRLWMQEKELYDEQGLFAFAKASVDYFTADTDDDVLTGFAKAAPP
jgi:CHAT domain